MKKWSRLRIVALLAEVSSARAWASLSRVARGWIHGAAQGGGPFAKELNLFALPYGTSTRLLDNTHPAVSTADYYHLDGLMWCRPYDLQNTFGAIGQTIATAIGYRYVWILGPDDADEILGWGHDAASIYLAYSNDPGVLPSPSSLQRIIPYRVNVPGIGLYEEFQAPWLVYNPDDATYPFYLYVEGHWKRNVREEEVLFRSNDLITWVPYGISHATQSGLTAYQTVYRLGAGNWISYGFADLTVRIPSRGVWTSADALRFTLDHKINATFNNREFWVRLGAPDVIIADQLYSVCVEDARNADGGEYVTRVPLDGNGNIDASDPSKIVRLSNKYAGLYPGPTYLKSVTGYVEDGVYHAWATHGMFSDVGTLHGASYATGGGLHEQFVDYYTFIDDPTAAAQAVPIGVRASCGGGVVTLSWYDALPNNTYRVYRGSTKTGGWTLIGDRRGTSYTDTPPLEQVWYYKVVTLQTGTERQCRVVRVYASAASPLVNNHIDRVLADGAEPTTIDATWLASVDAWLTSNDLTRHLLFWTDPAFGCKLDGHTIQKVYDFGTTRLPRGGDYTPFTRNTIYDATGLNRTVPAFANETPTAFGYYGSGRLNNIRRKSQITVVAAYQKSNTNLATFLSFGELGGFRLQNTTGSPGSASFSVASTRSSSILPVRQLYDLLLRLTAVPMNNTVTATKALTESTAHIIAGTFDGTKVTAYAEGVAGTAKQAYQINQPFEQVGVQAETYFLAVGSRNSKYSLGYIFGNNEAQFSASDLILFDTSLSAAQIASLTVLLRRRIGS